MPKDGRADGLKDHISGDTEKRVAESGETMITFADGNVGIKLRAFENGAFYGIVGHANKTFLLYFNDYGVNGYTSLIDEDTAFIQLSASLINDSDTETIKKAPKVEQCVICDKNDHSAGDSLVLSLRGSGINHSRTKHGNVSVRSDGRDIYLLPDVSCVE